MNPSISPCGVEGKILNKVRSQIMLERSKPFLRRFGWLYVAYHILVVLFIFFDSAEELTVSSVFIGAILYPIPAPTFLMCGGLHGGGCESWYGSVMMFVIFCMTVFGAISGLWVLLSVLFQRGKV